jgi:hypothetical protein
MNKKQKKNLIRIIIAIVMVVTLHFIPVEGIPRFVLYMAVYLLIGYDILIKAFKGIKNRQPLDESLLMAIATIGAIALALYEQSGDYIEAIAVMLFYQIGEWFQSYAVGKSRKNISELMDIAPDYANIEQENGQLEQVDPDDVEVGTIIVVQPGERVPIDGVVVKGVSSLNTAALTGESLPRDVHSGDEVIRLHAPVVGLSALMTTTVPAMEKTIQLLREQAPWAKVCVGGAVLTQEYADQIGADRYIFICRCPQSLYTHILRTSTTWCHLNLTISIASGKRICCVIVRNSNGR